MSKLLHTIRNRLTKQRWKNVVPCDLWKNWTLASSLTFILGCVFIVKGTQLLPLLIQIKLLKKSLAPSEADTRPGWHLSLHRDRGRNCSSSGCNDQSGWYLDTKAFTSILHATNSELQTPTQLENLDPGYIFQNVYFSLKLWYFRVRWKSVQNKK